MRALQILERIGAIVLLLAIEATQSTAATPCDFKGVSVGDKATPTTLMAAFGIKHFTMSPPGWKSDRKLETAKKYGIISAGEIEDWEIGASCNSDSCRIPFGVSVGNDNTPVSVFVSIPGGQVREIDVQFSEAYWDILTPVLSKKYGDSWRVERDEGFVVTNLEDGKSITTERITMTHRNNGRNSKTKDVCTIRATNIDMIFRHHDPLGALHSELVIKLVSDNF